MQRLLLLIYTYRTFLLFIALEIVSLRLIVTNNPYQSAAFFNTANYVVGNILETRQEIIDYFGLKRVNADLAEENARLREALSTRNQVNRLTFEKDTFIYLPPDTMFIPAKRENEPDLSAEAIGVDTGTVDVDSIIINQYDFIPAKVIGNSTRRFDNYITINQGSKAGIKTGMGVMSGNGVVGRVKAVSTHFATITSLLHTDVMVSSRLKGSETFCTTTWPGRDPQIAELLYVPRHIQVQPGDTVTTSGFNAIFPDNIMIGRVSEVNLRPNATFYDIKIKLSNDFYTLSYVYVISNKVIQEIDSLQGVSNIEF